MTDHAQWDFFISHASEDKLEVARPLADLLQSLGFKVWYDEFELKLGDSLNQSINKGLSASHFGIVILSLSFFAKNWPKLELDGLFALETSDGQPRILPIWHKVNKIDIANRSPILADRKAFSTTGGLETISREIIRAVEARIQLPDHLPTPAYDVLLPSDVLLAFKKIPAFKEREIQDEELTDLYQMLWIEEIRTRHRIQELTSSKKIIETVTKLYKEELLRSIEPIDYALAGSTFLKEGVTKLSIAYWRNLLHQTDEYRRKHPEAKVPPNVTVQLPQIWSGKVLMSILSQAHASSFDYDEPENEREVELISAFQSNIEDWGDLSELGEGAETVRASFEFTRQIQELNRSGFYVYSALTKGKLMIQNTVMENWKVAHIVVRRRNLEKIIVIRRQV